MTRKSKKIQKKKTTLILTAAAALAVVVLAVIFKMGSGDGSASKITPEGDLMISASAVTDKVQFYPYTTEDKVKMEVLAVKAPDGTIRTALNTCQICNNSGRGYYVQRGDVIICQNCGNQFSISQIEKIRGGCNPVPITTDEKTDDGTYILIQKSFMEENQELFLNWKK